MNTKNFCLAFILLFLTQLICCKGTIDPVYHTSYVAYFTGTDSEIGPERHLSIIDEDGANNRVVYNVEGDITSLEWFPYSKRIAFCENAKLKIIDLNTMSVRDVINDSTYRVDLISISPSGNQITFTKVFGLDFNEIGIVNVDGTENKTLVHFNQGCLYPKFASDGNKILFYSNKDLYQMNSDGSSLIQLTDGIEVSSFYTISPDGSKVVFVSSRTNLIKMNLTDRKLETIYSLEPSGGGTYLRYPAWSPNGKEIVFIERPGSMNQVVVLNLNTKQKRQVSFEEFGLIYNPRWNPTNQAIIFTTAWNGLNMIKVGSNEKYRKLLKSIPTAHIWEHCVSKKLFTYF